MEAQQLFVACLGYKIDMNLHENLYWQDFAKLQEQLHM